jgi:tetratricopeptide (TPR) repeat protein
MKSRSWIIAFISGLGLASIVFAANSSKKRAASEDKKAETFDFARKSFKEILDSYVFIADFNQKSGERPISKEVFWKYPFKLAPVVFDLDLAKIDLNSMVFQVKGSGARTEALNVGRVQFLASNYIKAHEAWLAGREEFKDDLKVNRFFDFFLAVNALAAYRDRLTLIGGNLQDPEVVAYSKRAAYFLASTYLQRKDSPDERIDKHAAWGLYNLAVIYYRFGRLRSVFGASQVGLATLLKQGRSDYRSQFRQLLAEAFIKNQDLISAVQELDTAIRQDPDPIQATRMFSRAGDIYYDLNNYELAEDFYAMASGIDRERQIFSPMQSMLRAESIFWLGRFEETEKLLRGAVDYSLKSGLASGTAPDINLSWAALRIADSILARASLARDKEKSKSLDQARLAYFRVETDFPKTEAANIAAVRGACLELPTYQGNNVKHARALLEDVKAKNEVPPNLMELVWACDAASYSDREKSDQMIAKVREFADKYPRSRFLDAMLPAVRDVQANKINEYFTKQQWESATDFFEQRRSALFQKIPNDIAGNLWIAYVATGRSLAAVPFWAAKSKKIDSDLEALRQAAFLFEASSVKKVKSLDQERIKLNATLEKRVWSKKPKSEEAAYLKRILTTKDVASAYPWIINIQESWFQLDEKTACESLFPLLSRVSEDKKSGQNSKKMVYLKVKSISEEVIDKIRSSDPSCLQSWIDFESKVLTLADLQKKYSLRSSWPLDGAWLESVWAMSERLGASDKDKDATAIWQRIAEQAPKDSFESRMAKTRLDPRKTEFESLWKK